MRSLGLILLVLLTVASVRTVGGRVEGAVFPVLAPAELHEAHSIQGSTTRIWGQSDRLRDCRFLRLEWRLGTPEKYVLIDLVLEEARTPIPFPGPFAIGPWNLPVTWEQIRVNSHAVAFHRCHGLWNTQTVFYAPPGS